MTRRNKTRNRRHATFWGIKDFGKPTEDERALSTMNIPLDDDIAYDRMNAKADYYLRQGWDEITIFVTDRYGETEDTFWRNYIEEGA